MAITAGYCNDTITGNAAISLLSTRSEYRGLGISRKLVYSMIDISRLASMQKILVDSINPIAVQLYLSCDFTIVGRESIDGKERTFLHLQLIKQ